MPRDNDPEHAAGSSNATRWAIANPLAAILIDIHARRSERAAASDPRDEQFSHAEIFKRDDWTCYLCLAPVDANLTFPHPMSASLDHVRPRTLGGSHTRANVRLAHLICNTRKSAKPPPIKLPPLRPRKD